MAEVLDWSATTGIIFSPGDLRYHESGGHPPTGPDYTTSTPRPLCFWQLPFSIWLERYGATAHWRPVIAVGPRVSRFVSRDAHSLLHTRAAFCRIYQAPAVLPQFNNAHQDRYLSPVLTDTIQPIRSLDAPPKDLACDKRRQKYAGLRLRRLSWKGASSGSNRSHFTWTERRRTSRGGHAREPGEMVPCSRAISKAESCSTQRLQLDSWSMKHLQAFRSIFHCAVRVATRGADPAQR